MSSAHHASHDRRRILRPFRRAVGALLSATLLVASGYYWLTFRNIERSVAQVSGLHTGAPTPTAGASSVTPQPPTKAINILIVGNDDRSNMTREEQLDLHVGAGSGSNSTDTMMLVHIPADGSRATLISLPRDSWVDIPGYGWGKLNGAYVDGYVNTSGSHLDKERAGANKLIDVVKDLTGQRIDNYLQVGLLGFYRIATALGGVPVDLCNDVDDANSGFHMTKGWHTLDGKQALEFVRQRDGLPGTDLGREKRQQYFLTAAFRQVASVGILTELKSLGDAIASSIFTDIDILDLARQISKLTANNIQGTTIPTTVGMVGTQDVLFVDKSRVRTFVAQQLGQLSTRTSSAPSASTSPTASPTTSSTTTKPPDSSCVN